MPVYEGYDLPHGILCLGGRDLAEHLTKILTGRGCSFSASAERKIVPDVMEKPGYIGVDSDFPLRRFVVPAEFQWQRSKRIPRHFFPDLHKA